jgi:hypothetical protein
MIYVGDESQYPQSVCAAEGQPLSARQQTRVVFNAGLTAPLRLDLHQPQDSVALALAGPAQSFDDRA